MTRYYIKNALLQKLCCGDVMISRRRVLVFLATLVVLSSISMMFVLYTITRHIVNSDNRYMERLRYQGSHYRDKFVNRSSIYIKPLQDKLNDHLARQQYDKQLQNAYNHVAANVETFRGKADTVIKQVRRDPEKYMAETGEQVRGYVQDTGQKVGESLQEAGRQSVDKMREVQKETKDLVEDVKANPEKYKERAKQQYQETYNKLEAGANEFGQEANRALKDVQEKAVDLQHRAAQGIQEIERRIDRARS